MYTYNSIDFGISFNNEGRYSNPFLTSCYKLFIEEFDCDSESRFYSDIIKEAKQDGIEIKEEALVQDFLDWVIENKEKVDFSTHYHGSSNTIPTALTFKDYQIKIQDDIDNFTWSSEYLDLLNSQLKEILEFCKNTMSENLYNYLTKHNLIGVNFLNVSS